MGVMRTLNSKGDTAVAWPETETPPAGGTSMSVEDVKAKFDEIVRGQGFVAFAVSSPTETEIVRDFPVDAPEILLVPKFVGG